MDPGIGETCIPELDVLNRVGVREVDEILIDHCIPKTIIREKLMLRKLKVALMREEIRLTQSRECQRVASSIVDSRTGGVIRRVVLEHVGHALERGSNKFDCIASEVKGSDCVMAKIGLEHKRVSTPARKNF